jgi:hypothetical protein
MEDHGEHNPGDHEDPLPGPTWIISILGTVLMAVVGLGVTALFYNADTRMVDAKVVNADYTHVEQVKQVQLAAIEGPPRKKEVLENEQKVETIIIPIDRAMEIYANRAAKTGQP